MLKKHIFFIAVLLLGASASAGAKDLTAAKVKSIYLDLDSQKVQGRLLPTAEVEILKEHDACFEIKISGFMQEDSKSVIYFARGKRILVAAFAKNAPVKIEAGEFTHESDTGKKWASVWVKAFVDKADLVADGASVTKAAALSFSENCSMCHALHKPSEFTANQWPSIVKTMGARVGMTKDDVLLVTQYPQKNAKDIQK